MIGTVLVVTEYRPLTCPKGKPYCINIHFDTDSDLGGVDTETFTETKEEAKQILPDLVVQTKKLMEKDFPQLKVVKAPPPIFLVGQSSLYKIIDQQVIEL